MADIKGTTRAQTQFLRMLRKPGKTYPVEQWPSPLLLRRWSKKEAFRDALKDIMDAYYTQSDLLLARATLRATNDLSDSFTAYEVVRGLLATIRLNHYHRNSVRRTTPPEPREFPEVNMEAFARLERAQEIGEAEEIARRALQQLVDLRSKLPDDERRRFEEEHNRAPDPNCTYDRTHWSPFRHELAKSLLPDATPPHSP